MADGILIAGLFLILIASEMVLRGGVGLARQFDVPPLYTGIFVLAILTVMPELFVTYRAATLGHTEMALGGIIGTNLFDLLFVIGLGALIHPLASAPKVLFRDGTAFLIGCAGLVVCALEGAISRGAGAILLIVFAGYLAILVVTDWRRAPDHSVPLARALLRSQGAMPSLAGSFFLLLLGIIVLGLGAHLSIVGGIHLATELGWSETTIGLIMIAFGLSSPKLFVTLVVAVRGEGAIVVGQILTTCALNLLAVLGLVALVHPLAIPEQLRHADVFVLAIASLILLPLLAMRWRLSRPRGVLLMLAYGCYLGFLLWRQGLPLPWEL